jgi:hypothetical protein
MCGQHRRARARGADVGDNVHLLHVTAGLLASFVSAGLPMAAMLVSTGRAAHVSRSTLHRVDCRHLVGESEAAFDGLAADGRPELGAHEYLGAFEDRLDSVESVGQLGNDLLLSAAIEQLDKFPGWQDKSLAEHLRQVDQRLDQARLHLHERPGRGHLKYRRGLGVNHLPEEKDEIRSGRQQVGVGRDIRSQLRWACEGERDGNPPLVPPRSEPDALRQGVTGDTGIWMGHKIDDSSNVRFTPAYVRFECDNMLLMMDREPIDRDDVTALVYMGMKPTDYAAHRWGLESLEARAALREQDACVGKLIQKLNARVG